jgi:autotransporter-associated beta strand protein
LGAFNHTGGTLTNISNDTWIGENNTGVWTMSGGTAVLGWVQFARNGSGVGTLNLNGGVFSATELVGGGGLGTNNMNGGTIKARANNANFMHDLDAANVLAGGVTFDTDTNTIGIAQALLDGTGGGGLTKIGAGTLNLNGVNTYTGPTVVNAGALGGSGVISGSVTVNAGGAIAPGTSVGTLSVNNGVTLGGTALMEVSKTGGVATSDLLLVSGNLVFGGTLKVVIAGSDALAFNDTFNLFDWGTRSGAFTSLDLPAAYLWDTSQLNVNGTIRVIGVVPAQVSGSKVVGGNFVFTGIGGPPGGTYSVLTSTNAAAPQAEWTTNRTGVFDSNAAFSNAIPVNAGEPARFFRMKTP